jgi:hypothetical protein
MLTPLKLSSLVAVISCRRLVPIQTNERASYGSTVKLVTLEPESRRVEGQLTTAWLVPSLLKKLTTPPIAALVAEGSVIGLDGLAKATL